MKLTPYQRIVRAAKEGRGVRLSAEECSQMGFMDEAIMAVARNDDELDAARAAAQSERARGEG